MPLPSSVLPSSDDDRGIAAGGLLELAELFGGCLLTKLASGPLQIRDLEAGSLRWAGWGGAVCWLRRLDAGWADSDAACV